VDNRIEVVMFKVGDLVRYKQCAVEGGSIGLIVKRNPIFHHMWSVKWLCGLEYQENEMNLELVKN
jgi:hypothetical protein